MRHRKKSVKLSRPRAQRKALIRSLLRAVMLYESIKTTKAKAKAIRTGVDKLIEWGKDNTLSSRRKADQILGDHKLTKKLFDKIAPRFKDINGGYTRIMDLNHRLGDGAKISLIELTQLEKKEEKKKKKKKERTTSDKPQKHEIPLKKQTKPNKDFFKGVRSVFKKERDAL
ncbi:MAG: 50S ribosomal protein L17 [Candidatus Omnitrophica bacterium]|nr:50S ribosomal protein L17 [Candidatus Omnitrophota bacterium]